MDVLLFPEFMDALLQLLTDFRRIGYQYECVLRHEVMLSKRIRMHDGLGPLRLQYKTLAPFMLLFSCGRAAFFRPHC